MVAGLMLASLLQLSPGVQLADSTGYRHVGLSDRLIFVDGDETPRPSLDQMTRAQMESEARRLEGERPSLIGPIVLLAVGGGVAIVGLGVAYSGLAFLAYNTARGVAATGLILLGAGAAMIIV